MKKFVSMIMALAMVLSLAACGANGGSETAAPETTAPVVKVESALEVLETIWAN